MNTIRRSVGHKGFNNSEDVKHVQRLLNRYCESIHKPPLRIDGIVGTNTIECIALFQSDVVKMVQPDHRIDPNGKTFSVLVGDFSKPITPVHLFYNIESGRLKGRVGAIRFDAYAGSGGRAGSKIKGVVNPLLANNSLATHVGGKRSAGTHFFGPIPQGKYILQAHEKRPNWIRLNPERGNYMHGRVGFAIHGRGQTGSHGCIVPNDFSVVTRLLKIVKGNDDAGKPAIRLQVFAQGNDIGRILKTA